MNDLPKAQLIFIFGILSIVGGVVCCFWLPGLVLGILAFIWGGKAMKEYEANPDSYSEESFGKVKKGKLFATIGMILSGVAGLILMILQFTGGLTSYSSAYM